MQFDPKKRIGHYEGISELKEHPWFEGFDWVALASREMKSPYKPDTITPVTVKYSDKTVRRQREARNLEEYERKLKKYGHIETHKAFEVYYYNIEDEE